MVNGVMSYMCENRIKTTHLFCVCVVSVYLKLTHCVCLQGNWIPLSSILFEYQMYPNLFTYEQSEQSEQRTVVRVSALCSFSESTEIIINTHTKRLINIIWGFYELKYSNPTISTIKYLALFINTLNSQ